ncbi:hypothetical protein KSP40_PGU009723 [Platanthera guangdongensis]|uniref:At5g58720/SDE5-like UBA-like domain-containing protein n=1 Tax=Platanthera guangdongensis TaxID=2320717 RepID=A0ABR2M280_9ASPA
MSNDADAKLCSPPRLRRQTLSLSPQVSGIPSRGCQKNRGNRESKEAIPALAQLRFPLLSLIQIDSAYQESGDDAYKAADILGAELVEPEESP